MPSRFSLDEDVTERLSGPLGALGYDVVPTRAVGRKGRKDFDQLLYAAVERRLLITFTAADFRLLHGARLMWSTAWGATPQAKPAGILVIEPGSGQGGPLSLPLLSSIVQSLVALATSFVNRLFAWNAARGLHEVV